MVQIKKIQAIATGCLILLLTMFASCTNEEEASVSEQASIRVSTMGHFLPQTRSMYGISDNMPVLQFKDEATYNNTVNKLKTMSEKERKVYMKTLGFTSAEQVLNTADEELDDIFEIEDENIFKSSLSKFQEKYRGLLAFDETDTYDVTPYLSFNDSIMNFVGNAKGYVVIGNHLVGPQNDTPNFTGTYTVTTKSNTRASVPGPIQPGFRSFNGASLTIKNGKYKSTMTLGRIVNGNSFAIEFVTKKKQFLWKKKVKASYSLNLEMSSSKFHHSNIVTCPSGPTICILNLPIDFVGTVFDASVTNFKSSRGNTIGSATFKNIQVR